jgi:hypothetical protein
MRTRILSAFGEGVSDDCFSSENSDYFEIMDPSSDDGVAQGRCIVCENGDGHFQVKNPESKSLTFLAIDHCMKFEKGIRLCDFALFHDEMICFTEIKNVKAKKRAAARSDARDQLYSTVSQFRSKVKMETHRVLAIIAFTTQHSYPVAKVQTQDAKIRFEDALQTELMEGNQITF